MNESAQIVVLCFDIFARGTLRASVQVGPCLGVRRARRKSRRRHGALPCHLREQPYLLLAESEPGVCCCYNWQNMNVRVLPFFCNFAAHVCEMSSIFCRVPRVVQKLSLPIVTF